MDYLSSEEYDLMFNNEYELWLLNQNKKKYKKMRETVYFVARYLVNGLNTDSILSDFRANYFEAIENASSNDLTTAVSFYEDIQHEIHDKRRLFLISCDYDPSESLDEMWQDEIAEFYTDLFFN
jgi:uncharacterized protein (DUF433 family)